MKVTQSCPTLRPHGLYSLWNSPGRNTGVGSCSHSPGDFLNPGIEPRSPLLQVDSLPAELKGSPRIPEWVVYPFSRGSSQPRNRTRVSCIAGGFFTTELSCVQSLGWEDALEKGKARKYANIFSKELICFGNTP